MKKLFQNTSVEKTSFFIIAILFVTWSLIFIYRSSFIVIDGKRYFGLFDDAMISMRYAWNFSHGLGLVWNKGVRVEGYTNLLMVLLMAVATAIFDKPAAVLAVQVTGILFMLGTAWFIKKISDEVMTENNSQYNQQLTGILSFAAALAYYPLCYWSLMGMETGLLAFLITLSVYLSLVYVKDRNFKYIFWLSGALGLAFLARNDALIYAVIVYAYIFFAIMKQGRGKIVFLLLGIATYLLFVFGQEIFRYFYYGELVPNTYILKLVGMPFLERLKNGFGFTRLFLLEVGAVLLFTLITTVFDFGKEKLYLISFLFASIAYEIYVGGDPWIYWRIMAPAVPLLMVVFVCALVELIARVPRFPANRAYFTSLVAIALVFGLISINFHFFREILFIDRPFQVLSNWRRVNNAVAINAVTKQAATLGVFSAGTLPYYADRNAIDFLGKSDPYIANLPPDTSGAILWAGMDSVPGHNKYDLNYSIKELRPTYVEGFVWGRQNLNAWAKKNYVRVIYKTKHGNVDLFLLKDSHAIYWNLVTIIGKWNN